VRLSQALKVCHKEAGEESSGVNAHELLELRSGKCGILCLYGLLPKWISFRESYAMVSFEQHPVEIKVCGRFSLKSLLAVLKRLAGG